MPDVVLFTPKAELDAQQNLKGFIKTCRDELTVFGAELLFDENVWDITEYLDLKGHGNKRHRLVFSTLETVKEKQPTHMSEPFLAFAKSYLQYMHGFRPTKNIAFRLTALRALESALSESGKMPNPIDTDSHQLNRAAQLIVDHYSDATAYRIGGQLELVASFLSDNKLIKIPLWWHNHIKRPGDTVRVGKSFDERRQEKMPSEAALDALPKIFRVAVETPDVIVSSAAALLCSAPDRISELLSLPNDCEVNHKRSISDKNDAFGLRWWPAKGADPMVKWIVPSMATVVKEALGKIRAETNEAREVVTWYENYPDKLYLSQSLEHLREKEWLSMKELAEVLGFHDRQAATAWCKLNKLDYVIKGKAGRVRFNDVQDAVITLLPEAFPVLDRRTGLRYSEALFVARKNEMNVQRGTYRCMIEPITINQINSGLGSRAQHGISSIFSRLGFSEPDETPIRITTHQFRHYLNTLAQAGGLSQLDIAKWSGRKDVRQNQAYDHTTPDQMLQKIRDAVGDSSQMFGPLAEMPKSVLIPRDEFARLKVPTAHTTDFGYCIHDYTMSPCQLHMDCINCEEMVCLKGDQIKEARLKQRLEETRALFNKAQDAVTGGYAGSDRWLEHHTVTVERLSQLCSIIDDPNVPIGAVIQLSSPATTQQIEDEPVQAALMADVLAAMGE